MPQEDTLLNTIKLKFVMLGNQDVGKSSIIQKYVHDTYTENANPTIGIDFKIKTIYHENNIIKLVIWDTAGQERYKSLTPHYLKACDVVVIVYDITCRESFDSVSDWYEDMDSLLDKQSFKIVVIGNKSDLESQRKISYIEGKDKAQSINAYKFFETCAKSGDNIKESFEMATAKILNLKGNLGANGSDGDSSIDHKQFKSRIVVGDQLSKSATSFDKSIFSCSC